jgi:hypothetical protein
MRTRSRMKGRRHGHHFSQLIHAYFESPEYAELSPRAVKALIDVYCQFRGGNNGDLCATFSIMKARGWKSKDQLAKAMQELLERGWLMVTRQGGRHLPTLLAVTFLPINECGGKLDMKPTVSPPHLWKRSSASPASVIFLPRSAGHIVPPFGARITA